MKLPLALWWQYKYRIIYTPRRIILWEKSQIAVSCFLPARIIDSWYMIVKTDKSYKLSSSDKRSADPRISTFYARSSCQARGWHSRRARESLHSSGLCQRTLDTNDDSHVNDNDVCQHLSFVEKYLSENKTVAKLIYRMLDHDRPKWLSTKRWHSSCK